jgi:hypothetical protein
MAQTSTTGISQLRRNAKRLARAQNLTYSQALDIEATGQGFANWSQLVKQCGRMQSAEPTPPSPRPTLTRAQVQEMLGLPRMKAGREEHKKIMAIVLRYARLVDADLEVQPLSLMMDIEACHCNGCPLDLDELLNAPRDTDVIHDVAGIQRYINRESGLLEEGFTPRYAVASLGSLGASA